MHLTSQTKTMPNNLRSDSENDRTGQGRLFGRERPIHEVLGGGKGTIIYFSLICPLNKPSIQQITCKWNQCQQYRSSNGSNMFPHIDFERFSMRKKNLFGAINSVLLLINKDFFWTCSCRCAVMEEEKYLSCTFGWNDSYMVSLWGCWVQFRDPSLSHLYHHYACVLHLVHWCRNI